MPCMCGDICCWSCGPAQGNSKCLVCGSWASEGCMDPDACAAAMPEALRQEALRNEAEAAAYADLDRFREGVLG